LGATGFEPTPDFSCKTADPESRAAKSAANRADFTPKTPSLDALAEALKALSDADRRRLAKLLSGGS
jgi:hypothetical protein